MPKQFKAGDKVEWHTSQGVTQGHVVRKQISKTQIKGRGL
jgi:hypothetical protein